MLLIVLTSAIESCCISFSANIKLISTLDVDLKGLIPLPKVPALNLWMAYYVLREKKMASHTKLFRSCSLLMTALFVYSASVQLNDPDWYSWFPLYACASVVNLMNWANPSKRIKHTAKATLWLGIFLFLKVAIEDFLTAKAGFWSLDLAERVVREKIGSGLVAISMILHLEASSATKDLTPIIPNYVLYGMAALVIFSYGLPFVFVVRTGEMKFDR